MDDDRSRQTEAAAAPSTLHRVLVANRGEIACRVLRGAKALGYQTVAVFSEADEAAPHVKLADAAYGLGPAPAAESYLSIERVLAAARATGCDAVHPGYGFLSENAAFAQACADADLVFVGPPAAAIRLMGNKAEARRHMLAAGVRCVPGYQGPDQSDRALAAAAAELGYPLMVKAAAGGGGRGLRLVHDGSELRPALARARSEAGAAFGSDELILERALHAPRHVEIQIFADGHGNVVHLGERDCSVQRRHQKLIEEAPCPVVGEDLRAAMGAAAVEAARSIGYRGAGTVEFLLDAEGRFYFLEMNTRLQVEHPVTEMITGLDLVELQFRVAEGRPLGFAQDDVRLDGHAIEARLYAEDPASDFLPSAGRISHWQAPTGTGVRVDAGVETGTELTAHYDPLIAKVVASGPSRDTARRRLIDALAATVLFGPRHNRDFLLDALARDRFVAGQATTAFIAEEYPNGFAPPAPAGAHLAIAAALESVPARDPAAASAVAVAPRLLNWSSHGRLVSHFDYGAGDESRAVAVHPLEPDLLRVDAAGSSHRIRVLERTATAARLRLDGQPVRVDFQVVLGSVHLSFAGRTARYANRLGRVEVAAAAGGGGRVTAPMHGVLREVFVAAGDTVVRGDRLLTLEAMKMQHEVRAGIDGVVAAVHYAPGAQVAADALLLEVVVG